jgi:hypothetical protein
MCDFFFLHLISSGSVKNFPQAITHFHTNKKKKKNQLSLGPKKKMTDKNDLRLKTTKPKTNARHIASAWTSKNCGGARRTAQFHHRMWHCISLGRGILRVSNPQKKTRNSTRAQRYAEPTRMSKPLSNDVSPNHLECLAKHRSPSSG